MPKSKSTISGLRDELFDTLAALRDPAAPMDLARAKAVAEVARAIIDTAKVEVNFLKVRRDVAGTRFLSDEDEPRQLNARKDVA